eukprot:TRINITY_DN18658_c0_g1_i1.p1 TRINITY_DN18658_c0_g1~~TRINITY_DN18658_c0_g1_i1.p1  ORF type:complete len:169 (+),score=10.65 TRINITY_DN18658_c0_g1_i1:60-566(+)
MALVVLTIMCIIFFGGGLHLVRAECPNDPLNECDFYVNGNMRSLPVYKLSAFLTDTIIGNAIYAKGGALLIQGNSNKGCFFTPPKPDKFECRNYISIGSRVPNGSPRIKVRTIPPNILPEFNHECIKMFIDQAQLQTRTGQIIYLNPNDVSDQGYPKARRCISFRTLT